MRESIRRCPSVQLLGRICHEQAWTSRVAQFKAGELAPKGIHLAHLVSIAEEADFEDPPNRRQRL